MSYPEIIFIDSRNNTWRLSQRVAIIAIFIFNKKPQKRLPTRTKNAPGSHEKTTDGTALSLVELGLNRFIRIAGHGRPDIPGSDMN